MIAASESWLTPASVAYIAECLYECQNAEMVADLRSFMPSEALKEAAKRLSPAKQQQIRNWVQLLNAQRQVAA